MRKPITAALVAILLTAGHAGAAGICGDVNATGGVTSSDALFVLKSAVGQPVALLCGPPGETLKTGEATSYGPGSDGNLKLGLVRAFTDNGDGTITDYTTGLMWEKKDDSGGIHDAANTYSWSTGTNNMNGTIATTFLATLNGGGGFAGYTDWRIPNRFELETLLNIGAVEPSVHEAFRAGCSPGCKATTCSCTIAGNYWSSSTLLSSPSSAWLVSFDYAAVFVGTKTSTGYARAVRTAPLFASMATCQAPDPPQCTMGDPCSDGTCSTTRGGCSYQHDCPLSPNEQCCCSGICL